MSGDLARVPQRPWLYDLLDRAGLKSYRAKIMAVAFLGIHVPLLTFAVTFVVSTEMDRETLVWVLIIALAATLAGTGLTLAALAALLRPVTLTAEALRDYRETRHVAPLPDDYSDAVGTLMADAGAMVEELERTVDRLEHVDPATELPNRRRALRLIGERAERGAPFAVAVLRFGSFERIAATLELERAERGAAVLAHRIGAALATEGLRREVLARVSTAEFALTLPVRGPDDEGVARRLGELAARCGGEIDLGDERVHVELAAGAALHPWDDCEPRALLDHALAAAALADEEAPVVLHSAEARVAARHRLRLDDELRRAVAGEELELHYQPVVDLARGGVVAAEALLRWRHPERGLLMPGTFVPVAEDSSLIAEIGRWTVRRACRQARDWADAGHPLAVAVNISARQLGDPELVGHVGRAVEEAGIPPERLEIELTESMAMADHGRSRSIVSGLRALGVGVAIDDFGTGYASLSHLRLLDFTKLKIDREFVRGVERDPVSQAICGSLIELSRGLGLAALAEGVETPEEVRHLRERGCTLFQGNVFSGAVPAQAVAGTVRGIAEGLAGLALAGADATHPKPLR
jgi:predicted signal transduction protein with EAL and GGDEF domain